MQYGPAVTLKNIVFLKWHGVYIDNLRIVILGLWDRIVIVL